MTHYICIHGHFYQPPRENPWLEEVEMQDSAWPYHDWNDRITAECYGPNAASRILNEQKRIINIVNNYSKISFNFGPTLLTWLERKAPTVYYEILLADQISQQNFSGHGSALAQVYNHMIMPLANSRDKRTQIIWGLKDFEHRFKRAPEGMWLAETAVDLETLDIMAELGLKFTILAPRQAKRIRKIGTSNWLDVSQERIDPKAAYLCRLPSGRYINIFFYDGQTSREIAFAGLLNNGNFFAEKLARLFNRQSSESQLVHVGTDGESYGHHHRFGDMALAYCLYHIEKKNLAKITIYGEFLEKHPASFEVEVFENSSWSCIHGIERWRSNCGCQSGINPNWQQNWRAPLREAMDWLRDKLTELFDQQASKYLKDPWTARDNYIEIILNRSEENLTKWLSHYGKKDLSKEEKAKVRQLLEMQRQAQLMYTSCGWFFDEVSGIETVQIMSYAARAIQMAKIAADWDLETEYLSLLAKVPSNIKELDNAATIYQQIISPQIADLPRVAAHYAISSLFTKNPDLFSYTAHNEVFDRVEFGKHKLAIGKTILSSKITGEEAPITFAVMYLGDQNIVAGARHYLDNGQFDQLRQKAKTAFLKGKSAEVISLIDKSFGEHSYSLWHLFKDEQRKIVSQISDPLIADMGRSMQRMFKDSLPLMKTMNELNIPLPRAFYAIARFIFNHDLLQLILDDDEQSLSKLQELTQEVNLWSIKLDKKALSFAATKKLNTLMNLWLKSPEDLAVLERIRLSLDIFNADLLQLDLDLWQAQNIYFALYKKIYQQKEQQAKQGNQTANQWLKYFSEIGALIRVRLS